MGKKGKKARSVLKDKRGSTSSPRAAPKEPKENNHTSESVDNGVVVEKEKKVCVHQENVDLEKVSSVLQAAESTGCQDCREGLIDRKGGKGKGKQGKKKSTSATWVCLHCGHFSCGGIGLPNTPQTHAVRHARQSRHPLVIQMENPHLRWCFSCSSLIPFDKLEDNGEQKDVLSDIFKLLKKKSPKVTSDNVVDIWFGTGSVLNDVKSVEKNKGNVSNGTDFYAVRGMQNLGNTCFFNSVMQNLLAIDTLRDHLLEFDESVGPLTSSLKKVFVEASPGSGLRNMINPKSLFGCVCAKAPQFRGYQQQDSHELLRCLLDGLSTEDLCAKKSSSSSLENGASVPVSSSFIEVIFGGQISSTVCCVECKHSSVVYEPFLDLSLPVPTKKTPTKKAQPVSRTRKNKMPPKRAVRARPKLNKDGYSGPVVSGCNPSSSSSSSSGLKGDSESCSLSAAHVVPGDPVDGNDVGSQSYNSIQPDDACTKVSKVDNEGTDATVRLDSLVPVTQTDVQDDDTWLDFVGPVSSDDQTLTLTVENEDLSTGQGSLSKGVDHDAISVQDVKESSDKVSGHNGELNVEPHSTQAGSEDERPLQVQDNEILLLPYKDDAALAVSEMKMDEVSSSAIDDGEDTLGFVGLGDLFDEPEAAVPPAATSSNMQANARFGNGYLAGNNTESDPDEVDNTDSPVSVESCLAHYVKPELLSGAHAWHCENCSKLLLEERRQLRKKQPKFASELQKNMSNDEGSSAEVAQIQDHSSDCFSIVVATANGNCDSDDNLKRHNTCHTNGLNSGLPLEQEDSAEPENLCSHATDVLDAPGLSHDASSGGKSVNSNVNVDLGAIGRPSVSEENEPEEVEDDDEDVVDSKSVKVMRDATKRMLINKSPPVLTIHLKRFAQDARGRLSKLNGHVAFKEFIDLRPYMDHRSTETENFVYCLVGVVEHSGSMRGGHYVAFVRGGDRRGKRPDEHGQVHSVWYYASDAHVREASFEEVLNSEAYILFYEKV